MRLREASGINQLLHADEWGEGANWLRDSWFAGLLPYCFLIFATRGHTRDRASLSYTPSVSLSPTPAPSSEHDDFLYLGASLIGVVAKQCNINTKLASGKWKWEENRSSEPYYLNRPLSSDTLRASGASQTSPLVPYIAAWDNLVQPWKDQPGLLWASPR